MRHVEVPPPQEPGEGAQGLEIAARVDRRAQRWLQDDLESGGGGLVEQMVPAAGDDRDLELTGIKCRRSTYGDYASPAFQSCDKGHHP